MHLLVISLSLLLIPGAVTAGCRTDSEFLIPPDPEAVEKALASEEKVVNAVWWGFRKEDATDAIQSAILSGAEKVIIPFVGDPWIIRPIRLVSNQEIHFEPGVLVLAMKGEFLGGGDSCFRGEGIENVKLFGYGATLRMHKRDYMRPPYPKAEWRMGISLLGSANIVIEGLRIESTGGDGIYLGAGKERAYCENITIRDVVCFDNYRQGLSVIGAKNLLVENCEFSNTWGTPPASGVDLEPNGPESPLTECLFRNCRFLNNEGHEIHVYLAESATHTEAISVTFENCLIRGGAAVGSIPEGVGDPTEYGRAGISLHGMRSASVSGVLSFVNCTIDGTGGESVRFVDKDSDRIKVTFAGCRFRSPWLVPHPDYAGYRVPILFELRHPDLCEKIGGVDFIDCKVFDSVDRPVVYLENPHNRKSLEKVGGRIEVYGNDEPEMRVGLEPVDVTLQVVPGVRKEEESDGTEG